MKITIFLNGKFIPEEQACVPILTPGFLYGWGLFETMRAYNKKIVYFDKHLERLKRSAKLLDIRCPYPLIKLKEIIHEAVKINGFRDAYVRLTLWKCEKGTDILVMVKKIIVLCVPKPLRELQGQWQGNGGKFKKSFSVKTETNLYDRR